MLIAIDLVCITAEFILETYKECIPQEHDEPPELEYPNHSFELAEEG